MKIIDGKNAILGRLASYVAKEVLKGEEIVIVNCREIIITGSKKNIKKEFEEKRSRIGSSQKGPKHPKTNEKIVKKTIQGMLPKSQRGKDLLKKIKCYSEVPKEFENEKKIGSGKDKKSKFMRIGEILK